MGLLLGSDEIVYDRKMLLSLRGDWSMHNWEWEPNDDARMRRFQKTVDAFSDVQTTLRVGLCSSNPGGNYIKSRTVTCGSYCNEYQALLQLGVIDADDLEGAMRQVNVSDMFTIGSPTIDDSVRVSSSQYIASGIVPVDNASALRFMQSFYQRSGKVYVLRFVSYIPTPNDSCSYDDTVFFGMPSKMGFGLYLDNGIRWLP